YYHVDFRRVLAGFWRFSYRPPTTGKQVFWPAYPRCTQVERSLGRLARRGWPSLDPRWRLFLFGALVAFRASGWMWLIPVATVLIAIVAISVGSNLGARAAHLYTLKDQEENGGCNSEGGCSCGSGGCGSSTEAPQVDMDALRNAVKNVE